MFESEADHFHYLLSWQKATFVYAGRISLTLRHAHCKTAVTFTTFLLQSIAIAHFAQM
jgi:hypothetical protein